GVGGIDSWGTDVEPACRLSGEADHRVSFLSELGASLPPYPVINRPFPVRARRKGPFSASAAVRDKSLPKHARALIIGANAKRKPPRSFGAVRDQRSSIL